MHTDSQTPADVPLIKAMDGDDDDDDLDWRGRETVRWKHKTRGYSFTDAKKSIPSGWLAGSMEKNLGGLGFVVVVKLNAPSWVSHYGLVST